MCFAQEVAGESASCPSGKLICEAGELATGARGRGGAREERGPVTRSLTLLVGII